MAIAEITRKIQSDKGTVKGPPCTVCAFISSLTDKEAAALNELLSDPAVRYSTLAESISDDPDYDVRFDAGTISRHVRGRCSARQKLR